MHRAWGNASEEYQRMVQAINKWPCDLDDPVLSMQVAAAKETLASPIQEQNARYMLTQSSFAPALRAMVWMVMGDVDSRILACQKSVK